MGSVLPSKKHAGVQLKMLDTDGAAIVGWLRILLNANERAPTRKALGESP